MLPAATQAEILRLAYAERWSLTRIAHHVGVNWKSVQKWKQHHRREHIPTAATYP